MVYKGIKFVYDEPAMVVNADGTEYLVIGDLHIGMELPMSKKGVHLFGATERMLKRIHTIMKEFELENIVMLGDVKESILYPESSEVRLLNNFFKELSHYEIKIIAGNHDAHLEGLIDHKVEKEFTIGNFGFIHGNRRPDEKMMLLDYIISAHEHLAVRIREENGAIYEQKAWAIYGINKKNAKETYGEFNSEIRLISIPAFNELIMGTSIEKGSKKMNPLLTGNVFKSKNPEIYNLVGQRIEL